MSRFWDWLAQVCFILGFFSFLAGYGILGLILCTMGWVAAMQENY